MRENRRLSAADAARLLDCHRSMITHYEKGSKLPSEGTLKDIIERFALNKGESKDLLEAIRHDLYESKYGKIQKRLGT